MLKSVVDGVNEANGSCPDGLQPLTRVFEDVSIWSGRGWPGSSPRASGSLSRAGPDLYSLSRVNDTLPPGLYGGNGGDECGLEQVMVV